MAVRLSIAIPVTVKAHGVVKRRGSHIFYLIGSQMVVRLSTLRTGRPLHPRKIPGAHFCERLSRPQGHNAAGRIRPIEKSSDHIGNWTHDLPACSIEIGILSLLSFRLFELLLDYPQHCGVPNNFCSICRHEEIWVPLDGNSIFQILQIVEPLQI
jgi:hypothetical protein